MKGVALSFCFIVCSFLAVHHADMRTPTQSREIASWKQPVKPMYDASFKF